MANPSLFAPAFRGLIAATTTDMVLKGAGVLAAFITLHQLSAYQYGLWQLVLSVVIAFGTVTFPGIMGMLVADISREIGLGNVRRANGIIVRAVQIFVSLSVLGSLAMFVSAPYIREVSGINIVSLVQLLSLSVFAIGMRQVYQAILTSRLQFVHGQAVKGIERIAYLLGIVFFLILMDRGFEGVVYAYVAASVAPILLYAPYLFSMWSSIFANYEKSNWEPFLQAAWIRGRWALASDGVNAATGALWPWVVGYFLSVEAIGAVGVAILLFSQVTSFIPLSYVLRSVLPRTVHSAERTREWLWRSMKVSLWSHMVGGLGMFAISFAIFPIWFPQHLHALPVFAALFISLPLRGLATVAAEWFYAAQLQRELFLVTSLPKALMFIILPLFLWIGALPGYALWYIVNSDILVYVRLRFIKDRIGFERGYRSLFTVDGVDVELIERALQAIRAKIMSLIR